jgi:hypothetical protein
VPRPRVEALPGQAWCGACQNFKPVEEFSKSSARWNGLHYCCKACSAEKHAAYRDSGASALRELKRRLAKYGLTVENYEQMLDEQEGVCKACKEPPATSYSLHVDHCHTTGRNRGLLCFRCNTTLGKVEDRVDLLEALIDYLKEN